MIVIYSLIRGIDVHRFEIIGTGISFIGCIVTVMDVNAKKVDPSQ